jgi:hypothetical protein
MLPKVPLKMPPFTSNPEPFKTTSVPEPLLMVSFDPSLFGVKVELVLRRISAKYRQVDVPNGNCRVSIAMTSPIELLSMREV